MAMLSDELQMLIAVGQRRLEEKRQAEVIAERERLDREAQCRKTDYLDVQRLLPEAVRPFLEEREGGDHSDPWQIQVLIPGFAPINLKAVRAATKDEWMLGTVKWKHSLEAEEFFLMRICRAYQDSDGELMFGVQNAYVADDWAEALAMAEEEGKRFVQLNKDLREREARKNGESVYIPCDDAGDVFVENLKGLVRHVVRTEFSG